MGNAQTRTIAEDRGDMALPAPPLGDEVLRSMRYCHQVTRERARNFYYGLKLTPEPRRSAGYAIYAFMRACDDLVDMPVDGRSEPPAAEVGLARIEAFRGQMQAVLDGKALPDGPMWPAFRHVLRTYSIAPADLHAMLDGQRCDLVKTRYETFEELYDYCYKVASVVGLVCIRIWGAPSDPAVLKMAEQRGIALQLTNILRDVVEDARRGRVYLPAEELKRFGYDADALISGKADEAFDRLMAFQIERAKGYYQMSLGLEPHLDASCRPTSWALMEIYRRLLNKIASNPRRVLTERVRLSSLQKAMIGLRATWRRRVADG
jgi:phytoene synthase